MLVFLDTWPAPILLGSPFGRLPIEEVRIDAPIQFVDVHDIKTVLQPVGLGVEPADGHLAMKAFVIVRLVQGPRNPLEYFIVE